MAVVVIGGGIIGMASAYYLSKLDHDVIVFEKSSLGSGSTGRANGGIRAQFSSVPNIQLSQESMRVWESFEEKFGVDIGYQRSGYLFLARRQSTANQLRGNVSIQRQFDVPSQFLQPADATEFCPELNTDEYVGAAYSPTDGVADPHLALQGYAEAASASGVEIKTGLEVTGLIMSPTSDRVVGLQTTTGEFQAEYVVNASGAWASEIATMAGIDLPIAPKRRSLMVVNPEQAVPQPHPLTADIDNSVHFRPERDGDAVVGGFFNADDPTVDPDLFSTKVTYEWMGEAMERVSACAGYFGPDSRMKRGWSGLYAVTPDHHPIIEETLPGLITAAGFSGHGFMHAPTTGKLVADLITPGRHPSIDISMLTSDRFVRNELLTEGTVLD